MTTKIFKSGNSNAVRLNQKIIKLAGLKENDEVSVSFDSSNGSIIIQPKKAISDDFLEALQSGFEKNKDVLDFLKDK